MAQIAKTDDSSVAKLEDAQQSYEIHKQNFEKLRSDVSIKLKFLEENRVNTWIYIDMDFKYAFFY